MGYHVNIVKTSGNETFPIREEEVRRLADKNESFSLENKGGYLNLKKTTTSGKDIYLIYQNGSIWAKNPNRDTIEFMIYLAVELDARVRGDELETYVTPDEIIIHPDDEPLIEQAKVLAKATKKRRNLRQFLINGFIFLLFFVLSVLVAKWS